MRSLDWTATQICVVTSRNRNWHSKNMVMENASWFSIMGLGSHRRTCHAFFMMNQMIAQPLALVGYLGNGKPPFQIWLPNHSCGSNHWDVLKLYAIGERGVYIILICSEKHHTPMSHYQWAAGLGGQTITSHLINITLLVLELTWLT